MKILHTGSLNTEDGGPALSGYLTLKGLNACGVKAEILAYMPPGNQKLIGTDIPIHLIPFPKNKKFLYSSSIKKYLKKCKLYDIYHAQGVWQYPTYALIDAAKKNNKPYVITPRGMLYPQDIKKNNTLIKKLSLKIRLLKDLNKASCIQATCMEEMKYCRELGIISPIAVIPNPIEIKEYKTNRQDGIFRLGYLGRLHPRKNVESLLYAFATLKEKTKNAKLIIIGGGDKKYEEFLKSETNRLGLKNVKFTGFLSGEIKNEVLSSLSLLAMPSEFENLGNVVLEGLIRKIPCLATKGSPWEELEKFNCGWWVDYSQPAITKAIENALSLPRKELVAMGERGYTLVCKNYSIETIAKKMVSLYEWILGGKKPDFVYLYSE